MPREALEVSTDALINRRKLAGLSRGQAAELTGLTRNHMGVLESTEGSRRVATTNVGALARAYGCEVVDLLTPDQAIALGATPKPDPGELEAAS